jgi:hypothetical protein
MKLNNSTLEKERDFYFGKLRDIELFLQANQEKQNQLSELVLKILYASEEEKVIIDDGGNLSIVPLGEEGAKKDDELLGNEEEAKEEEE